MYRYSQQMGMGVGLILYPFPPQTTSLSAGVSSPAVDLLAGAPAYMLDGPPVVRSPHIMVSPTRFPFDRRFEIESPFVWDVLPSLALRYPHSKTPPFILSLHMWL